MGFSITNVGKAKDVLKSIGIKVDEIIKGESADIKLDTSSVIREILDDGECKLFRALDKAGKYLKESMLTRSTSHKKYDFSSIQAESSLNLQKLYKDILDSDRVVNIPLINIDEKVKKEIDPLLKKMTKSLNNAIEVIKRNPQLPQKTQEELNLLSSNKAILDQLDKILPNNIIFSDDIKNIAKNNLAKQQFKKAAIAGLATPISATAGTLLSLGSLVLSVKVGLELGFGAAIVVPIVGITGGIVGLTVPLIVAAVFLVAGLIVLGNKERFGTIALKKEMIKINDEFRNALKYLNKAANLVRRNTKISDEKEESQPSEEQKEILTKFIEKQRELWEPYTSVEGHEYTNKSEKDIENGKHKSGLIKVKDEKTSSIGKMKLGIAETWSNVSIQK